MGTVADQSGAAVPGAHIRVRQTETDSSSETVSGSAGDYRFPFLKPGTYEITAKAAGLATTTVRIALSVGQEQSISLRLGVQSVQQSVEVSTSSGLIQTENCNQVTSFNQQFIQNTPVNGGDITNIAFSTPGLRLNVGGGNANFNRVGDRARKALFSQLWGWNARSRAQEDLRSFLYDKGNRRDGLRALGQQGNCGQASRRAEGS